MLKNKYTIYLIVLLILIVGSIYYFYNNQTTYTVYRAKNIITLENDNKLNNAIAINNEGNIEAVGSLEEIKTILKNKKYNIIDTYKDKTMVPGFIDPHLHLWLLSPILGLNIISPEEWNIPGKSVPAAQSPEQYMNRLKDLDKSLKPGKPLLTWGYHPLFHGKINREILDKTFKDRPILIWHRSAHEVIFNTAGLKYFNITEEDFSNKYAKGFANWKEGRAWERGAFLSVMPKLIPLMTSSFLEKGLKESMTYIHSNGLTSVADQGFTGSKKQFQFIANYLDKNKSPFTYYVIPNGLTIFEKNKNKSIDAINDLTSSSTKTAIWLDHQVKLFADGAFFSLLMQLKDGYLDGHKGAWLMEPKEFKEAFSLYWKNNYTISVHANGDMGVQEVIDNVIASQKEYPRDDHRTNIHHFGVSTLDQVKQIAKNNILVSTNPYYVTILGEIYSKMSLGKERASQMVRHKDLLNNNIKFSLHSDSPMAPPAPLLLMWSAVNRSDIKTGHTIGANQKIDVLNALKAVTINAAYALRQENKIGSLKAGKQADITILDEDVLNVEPQHIKDIKVLATIKQGQLHTITENNIKSQNKVAFNSLYHKLYTDKQVRSLLAMDQNQHKGSIDLCLYNTAIQLLIGTNSIFNS